MPWEVTLQRIDRQHMGELTALRTCIESAVPDIQYHTEPSGLEKLEAAKKMGVEFPDVLRTHFENLPATLNAVYTAENLMVRIYGFESQPLTKLHAEIRGCENPAPVLRQLCAMNSWTALDDQSGTNIELSDAPPKQWLDFLGYVDSILDENNATPPADKA
jgi:hypothetical protein